MASCNALEASVPKVWFLLCATIVWHQGLAVTVAITGTAGALVGFVNQSGSRVVKGGQWRGEEEGLVGGLQMTGVEALYST